MGKLVEEKEVYRVHIVTTTRFERENTRKYDACTCRGCGLLEMRIIWGIIELEKYRKTKSPEDGVAYSLRATLFVSTPLLFLRRVTSKNGAWMRFLPPGRAAWLENHRPKGGPRLDRARRTDSPRVSKLKLVAIKLL